MLFLTRMDLATARQHIQTCLDKMRAAYSRPVFDEWAILGPTTAGGVLAYNGPRPDVFRRQLPEDSELLRSRAAGKEFHEGDIEFVPDAKDTRYDAFVKIGPMTYLVLNHTVKTMNEITQDGKWLGAQKILFELTEKFRVDPLQT
jgi:hypothetical protein